jgi:hypothetical protein
MAAARDWSTRGAATDTLSDRRPVSDHVGTADDISIPEPRRSDDWPGAAPPAGWFLPATGRTATADSYTSTVDTGGRLATATEPEAPPDPIVFGPPASPWQRSHNLWAESGIEWEQLAPLPRDETRHRVEPHRQTAAATAAATATATATRTRTAGRHARHGRSAAQTEEAVRTEQAYANLLGAPVQISEQNPDLSQDTAWPTQELTEQELTEQDEALLLAPQTEQSRPRMLFGHRVMAMGVPVIVLAMVGALAVALLTGVGPKLGLSASQGDQPGRAPQDQTASLSPAAFPSYPGQQQRGVFESLNRVVASGNTIVVTGQQTGAGISRQQFFVSTNGGASWQAATEKAATGIGAANTTAPAPGHIAPLLAGGPGGWLAIGQQAIWTSQDGTAWTLVASHGISQVPGDQIWVVTRTAGGYLAGGSDARGQGVVWTSPDGVHWQRMTSSQLGIHALNIAYATSYGSDILITGGRPHGGSGAWLSTDGGRNWTSVTIPAGHDASGPITGIASDADGLLAVRDGAAGDAITYFSKNGLSWNYAGTIGAASGLRPRVVKGNGYGLVVAGQDNAGQLVAYLSADNGSTWRPTAILGNAAAESVVGAAVAPGDTAIAIGATAANGVSQQGVFVKATADTVLPVAMPGADIGQLSVNATAAAGGIQIAVGSANGYPAIWRRTGSTWSLVTRPGQFGSQLLANQGLATLTGVVHGPSGWLAVGANLILTSPDGVTWHAAGGTAALAAADLLAAAAGPAGYVVVGEEMTDTGPAPVGVWFSANLSDWTMASGTGSSGQMLAVAATSGGFAAVGTANHQPAVWISRDGQTWALTDLSPSGSVLRQVAAIGNRIVVMGSNAAGAPLAMLSTDGGTTWQVATLPQSGATTTVTALTAAPDGFTAVGATGAAGDQQLIEWTSPDGAAWTSDPIGTAGGTRAISALTEVGSSVTGIGEVDTAQSQQTILWAPR